jgi:O-acetylhomoserine/O-acetylserine sulfhydrylase-like pyridoxal-dependent enzyme
MQYASVCGRQYEYTHVAAGFFVYGRHYSPSVCHLGRQLAALEGTEAGYATSSGLSSIACALLNLCNTGDHIVASNTLYGAQYPWLWTQKEHSAVLLSPPAS